MPKRYSYKGTKLDKKLVQPMENAAKGIEDAWNTGAWLYNTADNLIPWVRLPDMPKMNVKGFKRGGTTKGKKPPKKRGRR